MQEKEIKLISPTCLYVLFRHLKMPLLPFVLIGVPAWMHWPVLGDLHEAAWLFILLSSLPYSFLSSSRADPSKMHFRWRRDSLLGASNIHQVCFYWLQEHTDDGKADWLLRSAGLGSPQMLVAVLQLQKKKESSISMWKGDVSSALLFSYCFYLLNLRCMGTPWTRDGSSLGILISSLAESKSYQVFVSLYQ